MSRPICTCGNYTALNGRGGHKQSCELCINFAQQIVIGLIAVLTILLLVRV